MVQSDFISSFKTGLCLVNIKEGDRFYILALD